MKHWLWVKHKSPTFLHFLQHFLKHYHFKLKSRYLQLTFLITTKSKSLATWSTQTNSCSFNFDIWYIFMLRTNTFFVSSYFKMLEKSLGRRTTFVFGLVILVSKTLGVLLINLHNEPSKSFDKWCTKNSSVN